jgi:chromosome segregation ATPase
MATLSEFKENLSHLREELVNKQREMENFEVEIGDDQYNEWLDEIYGDVEIAGFSYATGHALKELDPTAYRCGKNDYADSLDKEDDPGYQLLQEQVEELESEISDTEEQIEALEQEAENGDQ